MIILVYSHQDRLLTNKTIKFKHKEGGQQYTLQSGLLI